MIALDTNILLRLFVEPADDNERLQQAIAVKHLKSESTFFVPLTVCLELAWVLSKVYKCTPLALSDVFCHITRMTNVVVDGSEDLVRAAELHIRGLDFADALHCLRSSNCTKLLTFDDKGFSRKAKLLDLQPEIEVPV